MANTHLNDEQQPIFDHISNIGFDLYSINGTSWSSGGKMFFIKHLTNHLIQTAEKKILLCAPMAAAAARLTELHGHFRLPIKGPIMPFNRPT
jgi:hypothetical protein